MKLKIFETYDLLSSAAAQKIISTITQKPNAVLCLAAGNTPLKTYQVVAQQCKEMKIDFSKVHFIGLDEWVGIGPENSGSCQYFLRNNIFEPLAINPNNIHLFNAASKNLKAECSSMDEMIVDLGGIDLMLVGIGMNGHIGFNEPGVSSKSRSHVLALDETTQKEGQKYFTQKMALKQGITLGLKNVAEAKTALLLASGAKKAEIIKRTLEGGVTENVPASFIGEHNNSYVFLDTESASKLIQSKGFS